VAGVDREYVRVRGVTGVSRRGSLAKTLAGRYRLAALVGEGGMGVVWRARDLRLGRDVAVKVLRPFIASDPDLRRRFEREAQTLAGLACEQIVRVYDYGDDGQLAFLVMEFVDGPNLVGATFGRLPLELEEAAWYGSQIAEALAHAHARGIVHRDLTPANVLVERASDRVVTSDFGLARVARSAPSETSVGTLMGTPEYWSPEQATGGNVGAAGDVYALGCILFLLLSGRLPFMGDDRLAVGLRRAHEPAPGLRSVRPDLELEAAALVDSLLALAPADRPDAAAAAQMLRAYSATPTALRSRPDAFGSTPAQDTFANQRTRVLVPGAATTLAEALPNTPPDATSPVRHRRVRGRRLLVALAVVITTGAAILAGVFGGRSPKAPNVILLSEAAAHARLAKTLPHATVTVHRVYSTRTPAGRVIGERPPAGARVSDHTRVVLTVSKGSPLAGVPPVRAGVTTAQAAIAALRLKGFTGRLRWTPSWTVRKGTVIRLTPSSGTQVHRPAAVRVLIASGYPRAVVPPVENLGLDAARAQLETRHLGSYVVYQQDAGVPVGRVLRQLPKAGATVYSGTRIRLTVSRGHRWTPVLRQSGSGSFESTPFAVAGRWRVVLRLRSGGDWQLPVAQVNWAKDGSWFSSGGFVAHGTGIRSVPVSDADGSYRLAVTTFPGTSWQVEVDTFR
jgi:serine/threonine-protein kinase